MRTLYNNGKEAARAIRVDLKKAFPGVKFSVRSDYNSVNVGWNLGPTERDVQGIIGRYQGGSFNGMIDLYEYDNSTVCVDGEACRFSSVRYIFANRGYGDAFDQACVDYCKLQGIEWVGHNTLDGGEWVTTRVHRILGATTFSNEYRGLKRTDVKCGLVEEFYEAA